jgi:hypothetical protein
MALGERSEGRCDLLTSPKDSFSFLILDNMLVYYRWTSGTFGSLSFDIKKYHCIGDAKMPGGR